MAYKLRSYNYVYTSYIYFLEKLSSDGCAVHSPRFSPDKKYLIWLEREAGGPHHNAHRLMHLEFASENSKVFVYWNMLSLLFILFKFISLYFL